MSGPNFEQISYLDAVNNAEETSQKLLHAMENLGFVIFTDIPEFDEEELLEVSRTFFKLAHDQKMLCAKNVFNEKNSNIFRGFFPVIPGGHSLKEVFEIGSINSELPTKVRYTELGEPYMQDIVEEANVWPQFQNDISKRDSFKKLMLKYYAIYNDVAQAVINLFNKALNIDEQFFENMFGCGRNLTTFRLIHYPPRDNSNMHSGAIDPDDGAILTTGAHVDTSCITLLSTFNNPGLQVKYQSKWYDVPIVKNGLVMNIGKLLAQLAEHKLVATEHRVVDIGVDRYSAPFFFEPSFAAQIDTSIYGNKIHGLPANHYGPWMTRTTSQYAEYSSTDFGKAIIATN